ncbi:MAG TPA: HEPN domain-containing protein [Gemmataceae bacterium]|jgi:HEPN domain-containing protein|nr:HEPN domain-containing protein [Gemmataceae bacterium]
MELTAEHYYRAGLERMAQARLLYEAGKGNYAFTLYAAGLAVECILRAFRWRTAPSFEGRHDLLELFRASGLLAIDDARMQARGVPPEEATRYALELRGAMNTVVVLWANNYRFAAEDRVRAHLNAIGRYKGKKGDVLKANALELLNAVQMMIDKGVALWTSAKK